MAISKRSIKAVVIIMVILLTVSLAYILGTATGGYVSGRKAEKNRALQTEEVLKTMRNLTVGDTISEHIFEDLTDTPVKLSDFLSARTALTFFHPDCEECNTEIDLLGSTIDDPKDLRYFPFISSYTKGALKDVLSKHKVPITILYDHDDDYARSFHVWTFPFSIIVDQSRKVIEINANSLTKEEIREIIRLNKAVAGA